MNIFKIELISTRQPVVFCKVKLQVQVTLSYLCYHQTCRMEKSCYTN